MSAGKPTLAVVVEEEDEKPSNKSDKKILPPPLHAPKIRTATEVPSTAQLVIFSSTAVSAFVAFNHPDTRDYPVKVIMPNDGTSFTSICEETLCADRFGPAREKIEELYAHAKTDRLRFWVCERGGTASAFDYASVRKRATTYKPWLLLCCEFEHV